MQQAAVRFCPQCGGPLAVREVGGEKRNHWVCRRCGALHYEHPKVVVKGFVFHDRRLLLARRAIDPYRGLWAIPGGFLERGESLVEGAAREVLEETGIRLAADQLQFYMMGSVTIINQVHIAFRAAVDSDACRPGAESLACGFFSRDECPWEALAYPEVKDAMRQSYEDLERGQFAMWQTELGHAGYERRLIRER